MGDIIEFPGSGTLRPATDLLRARTAPGARRLASTMGEHEPMAVPGQVASMIARYPARRGQLQLDAPLSALFSPQEHPQSYDYSHTDCHKWPFMAVRGCGSGWPAASSPAPCAPCPVPQGVSPYLLRNSEARSWPMSLRARESSPVEDRPAWNVSGFLTWPLVWPLSRAIIWPVIPASSGHGAPGSPGGVGGTFFVPPRVPQVLVLPSVVRAIGPYSRGLRAFSACLAVSLWRMLAMRQTPNQVGEVHTRHTLLTSSLSHRRRGPGPTWGLPQQIRCDRGWVPVGERLSGGGP